MAPEGGVTMTSTNPVCSPTRTSEIGSWTGARPTERIERRPMSSPSGTQIFNPRASSSRTTGFLPDMMRAKPRLPKPKVSYPLSSRPSASSGSNRSRTNSISSRERNNSGSPYCSTSGYLPASALEVSTAPCNWPTRILRSTLRSSPCVPPP